MTRQLRGSAAVLRRNPVIVASLLGIGVALLAIPLPTPVGNLPGLLASSAGPTALFAEPGVRQRRREISAAGPAASEKLYRGARIMPRSERESAPL